MADGKFLLRNVAEDGKQTHQHLMDKGARLQEDKWRPLVLCSCAVFVMEMNCMVINSGRTWRQLGKVALILFFLFLSISLILFSCGVSGHYEGYYLKYALCLDRTGALSWLIMFSIYFEFPKMVLFKLFTAVFWAYHHLPRQI